LIALSLSADQINALLEVGGGLFVLGHCRAVWRDRQVKGVSIIATVFFLVWGIWNLYYYPSLGQWHSFAGGVFLTLANLLWVSLLIRFRHGGARG
jgi:hypothetical protein